MITYAFWKNVIPIENSLVVNITKWGELKDYLITSRTDSARATSSFGASKTKVLTFPSLH